MKTARVSRRMDHDRLFKELIANFFTEFIELFMPELTEYLDKDVSLVPLDKEVFTDITGGDKHEVDLLMRAKVRGHDAFFVFHVEAQGKRQVDFPQRMFVYFARLSEKYRLPVYPVVIFSYSKPNLVEPDFYEVTFPGKDVLRFEYKVIQLNQLSWRDFINQPNPIASALMAKMKMSLRERPLVKLECLRLLASLKLNPAKSKLIGGFIDSYLKLTANEMQQYEREFALWEPEERKATMTLISSWEQRGIDQGIEQGRQEGLQQGKERLLELQLQHRFSSLPSTLTNQLDDLTSDELDELAKALFDFKSLEDLETWLSHRQQ